MYESLEVHFIRKLLRKPYSLLYQIFKGHCQGCTH